MKSYYYYMNIYIYISNIIKDMWKKQEIQTWLDDCHPNIFQILRPCPAFAAATAAALLGVEPKKFRAGEAQRSWEFHQEENIQCETPGHDS